MKKKMIIMMMKPWPCSLKHSKVFSKRTCNHGVARLLISWPTLLVVRWPNLCCAPVGGSNKRRINTWGSALRNLLCWTRGWQRRSGGCLPSALRKQAWNSAPNCQLTKTDSPAVQILSESESVKLSLIQSARAKVTDMFSRNVQFRWQSANMRTFS